MNSLRVKVPGSTSNCGAGFDTLGLALKVYNTLSMTPLAPGVFKGAQASDVQAESMVAHAVAEFAAWTSSEPPGLVFGILGEVPPARGLGSSVTILAGVVAGLNRWAGDLLSREEMTALVTKIEGHPDNAMAGVLGGFCVGRCGATAAEYLDAVRVDVPESLKFVVVSPTVEISTKTSRGVLPSKIDHVDAVRSVNSAAYLTAAFISGDYTKLKNSVTDFLHEPYRLPGINGAKEAIVAGIATGALTGWLSGSGSSVLCVADTESAAAVAESMKAAFTRREVASESRILEADNVGLVVLE